MSKPVLNLDLYKNYKSDFPPDAFHHVAWKTMQYEKMVDFYTKLFGCEAVSYTHLTLPTKRIV